MRRIILPLAFTLAALMACGEGSKPALTPTPWTPRHTHYGCVQVGSGATYHGSNLRTRVLDLNVEADRCTDILWSDGERIFNVPPSEIEQLKVAYAPVRRG